MVRVLYLDRLKERTWSYSFWIERGEKKRKWRRENFNRKSHEIYVDTPAIWRTFSVHFLHFFFLTTLKLLFGEAGWFSDWNSCRNVWKLSTGKGKTSIGNPQICFDTPEIWRTKLFWNYDGVCKSPTGILRENFNGKSQGNLCCNLKKIFSLLFSFFLLTTLKLFLATKPAGFPTRIPAEVCAKFWWR